MKSSTEAQHGALIQAAHALVDATERPLTMSMITEVKATMATIREALAGLEKAA